MFLASSFEIISLLLLGLLVCVLLELVKPVPQTGTVSGTVSSSGDVEGVTMTIEKDGSVVASVLTDADGAYAFADELAIGEYTIRAHKDVEEGFLTGEMFITISGGENVEPDLLLVKGTERNSVIHTL